MDAYYGLAKRVTLKTSENSLSINRSAAIATLRQLRKHRWAAHFAANGARVRISLFASRPRVSPCIACAAYPGRHTQRDDRPER